jgi:PEP-CTERM motif-containing protein
MEHIMKSWLKVLALVLGLSIFAFQPGGADATVVTFDDLAGANLVPDGYGGINWTGGQWIYFDDVQPPYNPHSPPQRIYAPYDAAPFQFVTPNQVFDGAWFSGEATTSVQFQLFDGGLPVATSAVLVASDTPTFLASGYSGPVDEVRVLSNAPGYYVMDDVTYNQQATVPEPGTLALLATGLASLSARVLRRRHRGVWSRLTRRPH